MKAFVFCAAILVLAGCQRTEEAGVDTASTVVTDTSTQSSTSMTSTQTTDTALTEPAVVPVTLTEYRIDMPATLPAGLTRFTITNSGKAGHNFEIEGQGIEQELPSVLTPSQTASLEVDLVPGTYRVYCPVRDHATRHGMTRQLTVN